MESFVDYRNGSWICWIISNTTYCFVFCYGSYGIGKIEYEALLPGVIASFTASYTSHFLGLEKFSVNIQQSINMNDLKI